ncbi:MAG: hypothetical protein GY811_23375 [Myxococcales bacterium]|nr:hypothetical protein [Myxococcales bacterium]
MSRKPLSAAVVLLALALLPAVPARADEGESVFSLNVAGAGFSVPDHSAMGGVLGADYEYSLTDLIWLRASGGGGAFYDTTSEAPAYAGYAEVGITYVLDVLRYVPHVDLGVGGIVLHAEDIEEPVLPLISLGVGMDLLTSRTRSMGVFARFESFLGRSAFFQVGVRTSWRWGFF